MALLRQLILLLGLLPALLMGLAACDDCKESYTACDPDGASLRDVPVPGPDLGRLYLEMLYTVKAAPNNDDRASSPVRRSLGSLCCAPNTKCMLTRSFRIPMCYDRFTTNYFLTDGSFGSLSNGSYLTPAGDTANLISGDYQLANGERGNMYDEDPADKPETSELPMPTPWTSQGVGSAIPGSELGAITTSTGSTSPTATSVQATTPTLSSASASTSNSSLATTTSSFTIYGTVTYYSVTASISTAGGYGFPISNSTLVGPTATGTTGASTVTTFTGSPNVPFTGMAATSFICLLVPGIVISAIAAVLVG